MLNPIVYLHYLWTKMYRKGMLINTMLHEYLNNLIPWYTNRKQKCHVIPSEQAKHSHTPLKTNSIPSSMDRLHKLKRRNLQLHKQTSTPRHLLWPQYPHPQPFVEDSSSEQNRVHHIVLSICP